MSSPNAPAQAGPLAIPDTGAPDADSRLAVARRLYVYVVALVSYQVVLAALNSLLDILDQSWFMALEPALHTVNARLFFRDGLASNGGLLLVAVPLFLLHWNYAQRLARRSADEAGAGMRKFYLYAVLGTAMLYGLNALYRLVYGAGVIAIGAPLSDSGIWPTGWFQALVVSGIGFVLAQVWLGVLAADGDLGTESGLAGFWRRLLSTIAGLAGLVMVILGGAEIIRGFWSLLMGQLGQVADHLWWRAYLANGVAMILTGGYLLHFTGRRWQAICREHVVESGRGLRRLYLYGAVVVGALATLVPAAGLLEEGLRILFTGGAGDRWELLDKLGGPVAMIPLGFAAWVYYRRRIRLEEAAAPASDEATTIRRIYYYAVAATGLVLLWFGAVEIIQSGLDRLMVARAMVVSDYWLDGIARGLSLLIVGAPIWSLHWQAVERIARRPDLEGFWERSSAPRRVYLYGVALVGALLILAFLAQVAYRGFLVLLGDPQADFFSAQAVGDVAQALVAGVLWAVHILAIRADGRMNAAASFATGESSSQAVLLQRTRLEARIRRLEEELEHARRELDALPRVEPPPAEQNL